MGRVSHCERWPLDCDDRGVGEVSVVAGGGADGAAGVGGAGAGGAGSGLLGAPVFPSDSGVEWVAARTVPWGAVVRWTVTMLLCFLLGDRACL